MIDFFERDKIGQFGYVESIEIVSSFSRLFSDSSIPYLHYRVMENLFCSCFKAKNISRSDIAYDAKIATLGVGLKTLYFSISFINIFIFLGIIPMVILPIVT